MKIYFSKLILLFTATLISLFAISQTIVFAASKTKVSKITVKLPDGSNYSTSGTKAQLFNKIVLEDKIRDHLEDQIASLEDCLAKSCSFKEIKSNGSVGKEIQIQEEQKAEFIESLESKLENSDKIISEITKKLYTKAADASMLSPLTKTELNFFVSEVESLAEKTNEDLVEIKNGKNIALNDYFSKFERTNMYKANYSVETATNFFINTLEYHFNSYKKVVFGFKNIIASNNKDKIVEVNITPRLTVTDLINQTELNIEENLKR